MPTRAKWGQFAQRISSLIGLENREPGSALHSRAAVILLRLKTLETSANDSLRPKGVEMKKLVAVLLAISLLLLVPIVASADWMDTVFRQSNPNELAYYTDVSPECPITRDEATQILEGVFVRNRIKPLGGNAWKTRPFYLYVAMTCLKQNTVFTILGYFGNASGSVPILYDKNFGWFAVGPAEDQRAGLTATIERGITLYLKANLDLGK